MALPGPEVDFLHLRAAADALGRAGLDHLAEVQHRDVVGHIEHHVPLVAQVCDYVYCLNFGELLAEGTPDEVRSNPEVIRAYLGPSP